MSSQRSSKAWSAVAAAVALAVAPATASAAEYYVSQARGKGRAGSKEQPAKDLGNIASNLKDGDVVHLAQGTYLGKGEAGADALGVAVQLIGGWDDDFTRRDPWGAHRTVLTGTNTLSGSIQYRLDINASTCASEVVVDGIIFDNGPRNYYQDDKDLFILRKANAGKDRNATPESGGLRLRLGRGCNATVKNNVVLNTAPTGGAMAVQGGEGSKVVISNNLIINNTGEGIFAMSAWHPREPKGLPAFEVHHNTVLFSWKHDAIATYGGNALKLDNDLTLDAHDNVFGFGDYGGVDNIKKAKNIKVKDNLYFGNKLYDYREFNTAMTVDKLEDEAELLTTDSSGNISDASVKVPVGERWANLYASRTEVSRADVDAAAKVPNSGANALRGMLGLPLQAKGVAMDANLWLPRLQLDEALATGQAPYKERYGCSKPAAQ